MKLLPGCLVLPYLLLLPVAGHAQDAPQARRDPALVQGPSACGECHELSVEAWRASHHFKTFRDLPRTEKAREIADRLGIKRIKSESDCLGCHFTLAQQEEVAEPVAGISCESCHGAGADWIEVHSDFGGKDVTAASESPEHRAQRWARSEAVGMIRPSNLYRLAENCYQCHTVPNERLVNQGGHKAGSDFELVAWSQGEVRHNVWFNEGGANSEAGIERRRLMYVVGRLLDLEYALRGVAAATSKDTYALAMAKRARRAALAVKQLVDAGLDLPELREVLRIAGTVKITLNNGAALRTAADLIAQQTRGLAAAGEAADLSTVDTLLPEPGTYQGEAFQP